MRKRYAIAFLSSALLGTALHFGYLLLPNPITALFCPFNESVWEHLKLLYWPVLLTGFFLHRRKLQSQRAWSGTLLSMLLMPLVVTGVFYILHCGFSFNSSIVDIASYYLTLAFGFAVAYQAERSGKIEKLGGILVILVGLYGAALILFTYAAPDLPIFQQIIK